MRASLCGVLTQMRPCSDQHNRTVGKGSSAVESGLKYFIVIHSISWCNAQFIICLFNSHSDYHSDVAEKPANHCDSICILKRPSLLQTAVVLFYTLSEFCIESEFHSKHRMSILGFNSSYSFFLLLQPQRIRELLLQLGN